MAIQTSPEFKVARVNATADGVNNIIAAVVGKKIRVIAYNLTVNVAGKITIQDTTGTPVVLADLHLAVGVSAPFNGNVNQFAFETSSGKGLDISNPAGVDTFGHITYIEVE